jgi:hypothetical protein
MTGAAAIATPVKRKRTLKAAPREESRIKKGAATATAGTGQKNQIKQLKRELLTMLTLAERSPSNLLRK